MEDRIVRLVEAALSVQPEAENSQLVPCLVGPTGAGKTTRIRELARARGLEFQTLLPGTALPEDILGLPRVTDGITQWSLPAWAKEAREKPSVLLVDELDKARPETHAALLTLILERRVRDVSLHPGTIVVTAMQPVEPAVWLSDETGKALSARLVFIRAGYDWAWLGHRHGIDLSWLPAPKVMLPLLPVPSARQIEWCLAAIKQLPPAISGELIRGVLPEEVAERLEKAAAKDPRVRAASLITALKADPRLAAELTAAEIIAIGSVIPHRGRDITPAMLEEIFLRAHLLGEDVWNSFMDEFQHALASLHSDETIIGSEQEDDEDAFAEAIQRAAERAGDFYVSHGKGKKEKKNAR